MRVPTGLRAERRAQAPGFSSKPPTTAARVAAGGSAGATIACCWCAHQTNLQQSHHHPCSDGRHRGGAGRRGAPRLGRTVGVCARHRGAAARWWGRRRRRRAAAVEHPPCLCIHRARRPGGWVPAKHTCATHWSAAGRHQSRGCGRCDGASAGMGNRIKKKNGTDRLLYTCSYGEKNKREIDAGEKTQYTKEKQYTRPTTSLLLLRPARPCRPPLAWDQHAGGTTNPPRPRHLRQTVRPRPRRVARLAGGQSRSAG